MDGTRKQRYLIGTSCLWATAAMTLYVASYGPFNYFAWLANWAPGYVWHSLDRAYGPLRFVVDMAPEPVRAAYSTYVDYCSLEGYRQNGLVAAHPKHFLIWQR